MVVIIREFNLSDCEELCNLNLQLGFKLSEEKVKERLGFIINRRENKLFVAEYNGKVVGYVHGSVSERIYDDRLFLIHTLIVNENYRGLGIGTLLIKEIENWAIKNNYLAIGLWSRIDRVGAHKFYERHKYINERTQKYFLKYF